jgi:hypothetical protein
VIRNDDERCFRKWGVQFEAHRVKTKNAHHPAPKDKNFKTRFSPRFFELERPEKRIEKDSKNKEN